MLSYAADTKGQLGVNVKCVCVCVNEACNALAATEHNPEDEHTGLKSIFTKTVIGPLCNVLSE